MAAGAALAVSAGLDSVLAAASPVEAAAVIVDLAKRMLEQKASGIALNK